MIDFGIYIGEVMSRYKIDCLDFFLSRQDSMSHDVFIGNDDICFKFSYDIREGEVNIIVLRSPDTIDTMSEFSSGDSVNAIFYFSSIVGCKGSLIMAELDNLESIVEAFFEFLCNNLPVLSTFNEKYFSKAIKLRDDYFDSLHRDGGI